MTKSYFRACAYIIICVNAAFTSCNLHQTDALLEEADALLVEAPDSAYALLKEIDVASLSPGSERQARYALLYTKCQYKTYDDATTDSLISLAADFYEEHGSEEEKFYAYLYQGLVRYLLNDSYKASVSLFRAMKNSESVTDHYSKGQMYMYLSHVNSVQGCSDEEHYAALAAEEYEKGGLRSYYLNAMSSVAEARLRKEDFTSGTVLLDSILSVSLVEQDTTMIVELLLLKASNSVLYGSLADADSIYHQLRQSYHAEFSSQDYGNLAIISSVYAPDSIRVYLDSAQLLLYTRNDSISYWAKSLQAYRNAHDLVNFAAAEDTLLGYTEEMMREDIKHLTIAAQQDYTEWQLQRSENRLRRTRSILIFSIICILLFVLFFIERDKKNKAFHKAQMAEIKVLQMDLQMHIKERNEALQTIMSHSFVQDLKLSTNRTQGLSVTEWKQLEALFAEHLPQFETALRKMVDISDFELQVCLLLKLGITPGRIAILTHHSASSISETRSRLFAKAFHKKGSTADWDTFIGTI